MKWYVTVVRAGNIVAREEFNFKREAHKFMFHAGDSKYICKVGRSYVTHLIR